MRQVVYELTPTDPTADRIYGRALDKETAIRLAHTAVKEHGHAVQVWQKGGGGPASCVATVRAGGEE